MERRLCVRTQIALRRVQRHPLTRRVEKHVVKATAIGLVPSAINDVLIHHAPIDLGELIHVTEDSLTVSVLTLAMTLVTKYRPFG
jgi:hypothetical protein